MPSGTANISAIASAVHVSSSDAGSRRLMSVMTGCPVVIDFPRSPDAISPRYRTSCTGIGLSSPMVRRISSISALPALGPDAKKTAGSPGNTRINTNVTTITPNSAGIDATRRRPTRRRIPANNVLHPREVAEVGLAIELVSVAVHRLGHHGVVVRLPEHDQRRVGRENLDHLLAAFVVLRLVCLVAGIERQLFHRHVLPSREIPAL